MAEFIIDATDAQLGDAFDARQFYGPRLKEEIVRCRDCRFWVKDPTPIDPFWPMMCDDTGRDIVGPNGFCAWGERRDA